MEFEISNQSDLQLAIEDLCANLNLESQAYELTKCRQQVNAKLEDTGLEITNRMLKSQLIKRFDDHICFTYPLDTSLSQMFFSVNSWNN